MRHAKAEPYAPADRERALTRRGLADAAAAGRFLAEAGVLPEAALVSSAARTQQTWEQLAAAAGLSVRADLSDAMYAAPADSVLAHLRLLPEEARCAVFVGHNPCAAQLASLLQDGEGDPEALADLLAGFPTSAMAVLEVPGDWSDLVEGCARLTHFHVGRG